MGQPRLQQQDAYKQAWRVYRLVRSKQDALADLELQAFDDRMVQVAHALVLGEFRNSLFTKFEWYAIGAVFVTVPLLLTLILYSIFGNPHFWHDPAEVLIFYFGVFAAAFLVESCIAAIVMEMRDRRLKGQYAMHPVHRANEIAGCALASARGYGAELIGALLDAGAVDPEPSAATRRKLDEALIRLLPRCSHQTLQRLTRSQLRALCGRLARLGGTSRPPGLGRDINRDLLAEDDHLEAMVGVAILKVYERLPDEQAIVTVRSLARKSPVGRGTGCLTLIEAAKHCLPILEEIVIRSRTGNELLRGSDCSFNAADQLLRSHAMSDEDQAEELLRST